MGHFFAALRGEVYILMIAEVHFLNGDLHRFCGKRAFIDSGVYMRRNGGGVSMVTTSLPM